MSRILIVEDEAQIREMIRFVLEQEAFAVLEAGNAQEARNQLTAHKIDLILMDWMLPGRSGLEFTRELKQRSDTQGIPVIMLTARAEELSKVDGLNSGADDYVTKPFSPRELIARIRAVLRRSGHHNKHMPIEMGGLYIDPVKHQVSSNGRKLELSPSEYRLLLFFMTHPDRAYTRTQILDQVWGDDTYIEERTVDVHIRRLRKYLSHSEHDRYIQTIRGVGYLFSTQI
ncbi:MAG: phosphate regulon transcriptional regulator PhoB [Chromatiales bacterium]|jgi:two-component system phosphate regulon response regulator PhoB